MRLHKGLTINGVTHAAGSEVSPWLVYPFFLVHMGVFGASGFFMAYFAEDVPLLFLFAHGGFAIAIYLVFYRAIFGMDTVKWTLINAALGAGAYLSTIDTVLGAFGRDADDFGWLRHAIPFGYTVLYAFLLRQAVLDFSGVRDTPKQDLVEWVYVIGSALLWLLLAR